MENKTLAVNQGNDIRSLIASDVVKKQIALALPKHMSADRMSRIMLTAMTRTPKLLECTKESLLTCLMSLSQFGLEPDGRNAHLIPYEDKKKQITTCTLIIDYKGLVSLVRRSGDVSDIHADVICEGDEIDYCFGTGSHLKHKPALKDRGEAIAFYSYVRLKDGSESFEVLSLDEVLSVRDRSNGYKAYKDGYTKTNPWETDFREMGKKTAFRRHSKWLPLSTEVLDAIAADDDAVGEATRFEQAKPAKPDFSNPLAATTPKVNIEPIPQNSPVVAAPVDTQTTPAPASAPATSDGGPSDLDQLHDLCDQNGVDLNALPEALKTLNRLPARSSIKKLDELMDSSLAWAVANFEQVLKYLPAK